MRGLVVRELTCDYGCGPVLADLSFTVSRGEAIAIIGPSGSGKTTLAHCLVGIIPERSECNVSGDVFLDGKSILKGDFEDRGRKINIIMQNYEVQIFGLTVEEDIVFGLENLGLDHEEIEERLEWALRTFGLMKYRNYSTSKLSGGLRQRLAIASTVVLQPEFLVMDDPTSNLDWRGIKSLRGIVSMLKSQGKGVVILTRRIKGLKPVLERIYWLNDGKLEPISGSYRRQLLRRWQGEKKGKDAIQADGVWFKYSNGYVLRDISLRVRLGEAISIMGPNGSGKTTLVKHFNSLLKPTKGRMTVLGMDTRKFTTAEMSRYVGFVFQDPDRHLACETVWDEARFGCRNLGLPDDYAKRALEELGLKDKMDEPPYSLSMGEKTRLSIASAMAMNPRIMVLDEPTTGQDDRTLRMIGDVIWRMRSEGKTVVVVTHDSDFALNVSDRIIVIYNGEVVADSTPEKVLLDQRLIDEFELEPPETIQGR